MAAEERKAAMAAEERKAVCSPLSSDERRARSGMTCTVVVYILLL